MKEGELKDLKTDVKLLLECLEYQRNDVNAVKQGLVTLSAILHDSVEAKDEFQELGGIEQVLSLVINDKQNEIVEAGLYCLGSAVEKNVYSQKLLSNASVFTFLHSILSARKGMSGRKKQTVSYLILCLVTNNGFGQNLARQSSCLQDILNLVRSAFPHNGRMDFNFFDNNGNSMYDLWTTLLSAACACINNPVNEENQSICASLFPYLFNLLTSQSENQIIRPILSFIGHAVASHSCNQERVRKCGGIEILVKELKIFQRQMDSDAGANLTNVQLLFTLDACISENELSCKRFGELEGIKVVLSMLDFCNMDVGDRMQAVLILAHSVDAYAENEKYIKEGHGITVLIQQLTASDDEELNKIVKYLLRLCVSKEDCTENARGNGSHSMLSQMEAMKRLGDMQMLEKISDLDKRLKYLQNRNPDNNCFDDARESNYSSKYERLEQVGLIADTTTTKSSLSHVQEHPETPRERSLLAELIKEKVEREKLEKLNHGLQETLIRNKSAGFQQDGKFVGPDCVTVSKSENDRQVRNECHAVCKDRSIFESQPYGTEKPKHPTFETYQHSDYDTKFTAKNQLYQGNIGSCGKPNIDKINTMRENINKNNLNSSEKYIDQYSTSSVSQKDFPKVRKHSDQNDNVQTVLYTAVSKDLSKHSQEPNKMNQTIPSDKIINAVNGSNCRPCQGTIITDACNIIPKKSTKINRNAEIQCGTPFVLVSDQQSKIDSGIEVSSCMSDCSVQTDFVNKPTIKLASSCIDEERNRSEIMFVITDKHTTSTGNTVHSANGKGPWVCLENSKIVNELINKAIESHNDQVQSLPKPSPINSSKSKKSDVFFVKPIARPPKGKVRVTPLLGLNTDQGKFSSQHSVRSERSSAMSSNSNMLSEFDMNLMKNVQKKPGISAYKKYPSKPQVSVVKSQNNVRHIDELVELQEENVATKWHVQPTTPSRQTIKPVRPAFSDCGTRRYSISTSSAIKSPAYIRGCSIDDSGIHSPFHELNVMNWGSPIDSDIDGFRSSSDVSDDEVPKPCINADVLRSSKKKQTENDACPGCKGPYKGDLELNSRTYNIVLETDSNTCCLHRRIRQFERNHIHKLRKSLRTKPKGRIMYTKADSMGKKLKSNEHDKFEFNSESDFEISPVSDDNFDVTLSCKTRKQRRQRVPYTAEEEANILQGVEKLGKYWNQILVTYKFHPSRTNVDLMWKYKRMMSACNRSKASSCKFAQTKNHRPFSMCEERRLRRGIMKFGYNWKTILKSFTFSEGRTTEDLRNKWRSIHGKK